MEIRKIKKESLTVGEEIFVRKCLLELWDIEREHIAEPIRSDLGSPEEASSFVYHMLKDVYIATIREIPVGLLGTAVGFPLHVDKMHVVEPHRRSGVGRCLLNAFQLTVERDIEVCITPGNTGALSFYQGSGFAVRQVDALYKEEFPFSTIVGIRNYSGV